MGEEQTLRVSDADILEIVELYNDPSRIYHLVVRRASPSQLVMISKQLQENETVKSKFIVTNPDFNIVGEFVKAEGLCYIVHNAQVNTFEEYMRNNFWWRPRT